MNEPRKKRRTYNTPGEAHELTFSCYRRFALLDPEPVKELFLAQLDKAREQFAFEVWAYVIMPDHVHLLLWPTTIVYDMMRILKVIKEQTAKAAIKTYREHRPELLDAIRVEWPSGRTEHRFWQQGGGYDRNLWTPIAIHASIEYIHNNPVRAGIVEAATDWRWSSARWYADMEDIALRVDDCRMVAAR